MRHAGCVLAIAVAALAGCGSSEPAPSAPASDAGNRGFSEDAQSVGTRNDGLVLRSIRHARHAGFYRIVFDIGLAGGQPARTAPRASARYRARDRSIELSIAGVRDDLTGNLPLETENGQPFGKPVPIDRAPVDHLARLLVLDDSQVAYRIQLTRGSTFRLLALADPARIVLDVAAR